MSGYSEQFLAERRREFMERWAPDSLPPLTEETLRWNIARARAAEDELSRLKQAAKVLFDGLGLR